MKNSSNKKRILDISNTEIINSIDLAIEVKGLNFYYNKGKKHVLKDINLKIYKKSITALIGPSGCGKSTFLRTLNRMNDLISDISIDGEVIINNKNIYSASQNVTKLRTNVGMVFQKANPFPMSIYDNVAFGPKSQGLRNKLILNKIVKESLVKSALWDEVKDILKEPAEGLSGGQKQRLCIARAIALQPKILLMDEPTSALDPISTLKIEELLRNLKKEFTIIIVTHQMQQAARIANYTAFFYGGELIEFNNTKIIFSKPKYKRTENYITGRFG